MNKMLLISRNLIRQVHTSSIVVTKAVEQDRKDILRIMQDVFYKTDPSSVYTKVSEASKISLLMQEMTLESLSENLSFVAKERNNQKLLGVAINGIRPVTVKPQYMTPMLQLVKSKSEKALLELWQFVSCMPSNAENYFKNDNQVFEVRYLAVEPSHQNMGIASSLVTHSKKEAAANGLKYIRIDCTSHYTARIASTMGLDCIYQINYEDYRNPSGEHVFRDVTYPHTKILVYAGKTS